MGSSLSKENKKDEASCIFDTELAQYESEIRHRPQAIDSLVSQVRFSRREVQMLYRGFKEVCPRSVIDMDNFLRYFMYWFPAGLDKPQYARYVYMTLDRNNDGVINFEEFLLGLSVLSRGTVNEKLEWIFDLYDIQKDGVITVDELQLVINAMHDMLYTETGRRYAIVMHEHDFYAARANELIHKFEVVRDGVRTGRITKQRFMEVCLNDKLICESLKVFDTAFRRPDSDN